MNNNIGKVALELNLPVDVVERTYKAWWLFIKNTIEALPLKDDLSEESFNKLKTNINLPSLGKLSCTYNRYKSIKSRYKNIKKLRNAKDN